MLAEMVGKKIHEKRPIITVKCEMFLDIFQQNLDLELKLEDTIDTVDNESPEAFALLMTQECKGACLERKNRNQVCEIILFLLKMKKSNKALHL
jgi:hypothetical protein